jgi:hypothetical protein
MITVGGTYYCIGIIAGVDLADFTPEFEEDLSLIADFSFAPIVCESRESLELVVEGYEPPKGREPPANKMVHIILRRTGSSTPVYTRIVNNTSLLGRPVLKWRVR